MPAHFHQTVSNLIEQWKEEEFNGVQFEELYIEEQPWSDWEAAGKTREEYKQWLADYVIFVAEPNFQDMMTDSKYVHLDLQQFYIDMQEELEAELGYDAVKITHRPGSSEFELERKNNGVLQ